MFQEFRGPPVWNRVKRMAWATRFWGLTWVFYIGRYVCDDVRLLALLAVGFPCSCVFELCGLFGWGYEFFASHYFILKYIECEIYACKFLLESVTLMVILKNKKMIYEKKIKNKNKKDGRKAIRKNKSFLFSVLINLSATYFLNFTINVNVHKNCHTIRMSLKLLFYFFSQVLIQELIFTAMLSSCMSVI